MSSHDVGDTVRLWAAFHDEAGAQAIPTLVTLIVRSPDGVDNDVSTQGATAADLVLASASVGETLATTTGVFKALVRVSQSGLWRYEWTGLGTVDEAQSGWFEVRRRVVDEPLGTRGDTAASRAEAYAATVSTA